MEEEIAHLQGPQNRFSASNTNPGISGDQSNSPNQSRNISVTEADGTKTSLPKQSNASDNSSSGTLGLVNPSLQGSLLSVDGRPPSTISKTRNITQV